MRAKLCVTLSSSSMINTDPGDASETVPDTAVIVTECRI
jgi:hypothetical protein